MVRDHPGVRVMVDHCGFPIHTDPASMRHWKEGECMNMTLFGHFVTFSFHFANFFQFSNFLATLPLLVFT